MNNGYYDGFENSSALPEEEAALAVTPQPSPTTDGTQQNQSKAEPVSPLQGIGKFFEENIAIPLIDQLDQSRNADQVAADRADARQGIADLDQQVIDNPTVLGETGAAVVGGAAGVIDNDWASAAATASFSLSNDLRASPVTLSTILPEIR
jgi:hypothetical protein